MRIGDLEGEAAIAVAPLATVAILLIVVGGSIGAVFGLVGAGVVDEPGFGIPGGIPPSFGASDGVAVTSLAPLVLSRVRARIAGEVGW